MTDNLTKEELVQIQRALGQRRKEYLKAADHVTSAVIGSAYRKVQSLLADVYMADPYVEEITPESAPVPPRPRQTRRKKEETA